ncbi:MAG: 5-formyltetrahydrofolate cyclo-ligase [Candidatus Accumulibacter sp.]|jgi:5,10-methenyltetrahydrofolate synthetase|nr:5-formyltetrahydrofolate cyclo-ligase [Accumulibacter sp.]
MAHEPTFDTDEAKARTDARRALRAHLIERRLAVSPSTHALYSSRISDSLQAHFPELEERRVAFCWPMKNEPDLRPLLRRWTQRNRPGFMALLPVVKKRGTALVFRKWTPDAPMATDAFGLAVPDEDAETANPEALLIPVNAFDAAGYRLGYGGGFFDRTLAQLEPPPLAIGIGFEMARVDSIDPAAHDRRLNAVVTEAGVYRFG